MQAVSIEASTVFEVVGELGYAHKTTLSDVFNTLDEAVASGARFSGDDAARIRRELDEIAYWAERLTNLVNNNTLGG